LAEVFQYLVVFLLATWTARLAKTKGRNAWGWGGAALVLGLLPWHLFGVLPVLILLFIKLPADSPGVQAERLACARCAKTHSEGQHFCTGCGWDLNEAYSPEETDESLPFPSRPQVQTTLPSTGVAQPPEAPEAPEIPETPEAEPAVAETPAPEVVDATVADAPQQPEGEPNQTGETPPEPAEAEPEKEYVPWGTYDPGVAPTAAVMTSRGIERFDAGKYQEAIDQFTKAIALDPNYADAWQRRAEAYSQLGRAQQAEEDRRHLQGLDPSSSPG
jgi:hypothetical protein